MCHNERVALVMLTDYKPNKFQSTPPDLDAIRAAYRAHRPAHSPHARHHFFLARRDRRRAAILQMRESAKDRLVQNSRRDERGFFADRSRRRNNGVVAPSSGNHAAALALAARWRGIPAYIVMPSNSSAVKKRAVQAYGGKITECEPNIASRESVTAEVMNRTGAHLVHPYNDARVIAGQGTAALELLEEVPDLDIVIAPVSGGGLLSGTAIAAKGMRPEIRVIGGEPRNADDAYRSLASGKIEPQSASETMADGLRATLVPADVFDPARARSRKFRWSPKKKSSRRCCCCGSAMKIVVEPSGAVAAAPALFRKIGAAGKKIGIILSGGNLDLHKLPFVAAA